MTTAREQSREVADRFLVPPAHPVDIADAVSDLWEPLLRDLLKAVDVLGAPVPFRYEWAIDKAREALG